MSIEYSPPVIFAQKPKVLYRLESMDPSNGLWYNANGDPAWGIGDIENCETKHLPMGYDWRYRQDGRLWHSSCSRIGDLAHWYSLENALALIDRGFEFAEYLATEYHEYDQETVFIKDTCLWRRPIDIRDIWKQ